MTSLPQAHGSGQKTYHPTEYISHAQPLYPIVHDTTPYELVPYSNNMPSDGIKKEQGTQSLPQWCMTRVWYQQYDSAESAHIPRC